MNVKTVWTIKSNEEMEKLRMQAERLFPKVLDMGELERTSDFFMGLSDATRLKIISLLWMEDMCMCELVEVLGGASSTITHHLRIMERGGLIGARKDGKFTIYHLNKEIIIPIIPYLGGGHGENFGE